MSDEETQAVRLADITLHEAVTVTVQCDPEHGCIDIVIKGTDKYRHARMTIYGVYDEEDRTVAPAVVMLADVKPEPEDDDDD